MRDCTLVYLLAIVMTNEQGTSSLELELEPKLSLLLITRRKFLTSFPQIGRLRLLINMENCNGIKKGDCEPDAVLGKYNFSKVRRLTAARLHLCDNHNHPGAALNPSSS